MKLVFVTEARFTKGKGGVIYGDMAFSTVLWERYLTRFDHVYVFARVRELVDYVGDAHCISSGERITFVELPYYLGFLDFLFKKRKLVNVIQREGKRLLDCKFICRVPGTIGTIVADFLYKSGKKYAVEVVGDPDDVFAPGGIRHPLSFYFRSVFVKDLQRSILNAAAVLYVTRDALQAKYPTSDGVYSVSASNVNIKKRLFALEPRVFGDQKRFVLMSVGSLAQLYKAPDVIIESLRILKEMYTDVEYRLVWAGDGIYRREMEELSRKLGVEEAVSFLGAVSREKVLEELKQSDLFVLVSRTEGLPRAMIEAMAMGLPVVGTRVGGIPELVGEEVLVEKNDPVALSELIRKFSTDALFYNTQADKNLSEAKSYEESILRNRREDFYDFIAMNL